MVPVEPLTKDGLLTSGKRSVREKIHTKPPWLMGGWSWFPLSRDDSPLNQGKKSSTTPIDLETEKSLYRIPTNPFFLGKNTSRNSVTSGPSLQLSRDSRSADAERPSPAGAKTSTDLWDQRPQRMKSQMVKGIAGSMLS